MKKRSNEDNPIVRQEDLKDYLSANDNKYLQKIVRDVISKKPAWFANVIDDIMLEELRNNMKINISGYSTIEIKILYKGNLITSASKYHPRG
ncbi:MAG: hypothetical protein IJH39_11910 [Clostridia bacterium]|nr:hypothetical protein [Clostridia bacterium]